MAHFIVLDLSAPGNFTVLQMRGLRPRGGLAQDSQVVLSETSVEGRKQEGREGRREVWRWLWRMHRGTLSPFLSSRSSQS